MLKNWDRITAAANGKSISMEAETPTGNDALAWQIKSKHLVRW
jgi:hypothetical protein